MCKESSFALPKRRHQSTVIPCRRFQLLKHYYSRAGTRSCVAINILDIGNLLSTERTLCTSQCTAVTGHQVTTRTEYGRGRFVHAHTTELGVVDLAEQLLDFHSAFLCKTDWPERFGFQVNGVGVVLFVNVLNRGLQ